MQGPRVLVRVVQDHEYDRGDYHQWITLGARVWANRLGYSNPRMCFAEWTKWVCNSGSCSGWALVHDDAVVALIKEQERTVRPGLDLIPGFLDNGRSTPPREKMLP